VNSKIEVDAGFWNLMRAYLESSIVEFKDSAIEETRISLNEFVNAVQKLSVPLGFLDFSTYKESDLSQFSNDQIGHFFASGIIAHTYERLLIVQDLILGWIDSLRSGSILPACLLSRSMLEFGADAISDLEKLKSEIKKLSINEFDRFSKDPSSSLFGCVRNIRYSGKSEAWNLANTQTNIMTAIKKLPDWVSQSYDDLSEVCHPNSASGSNYWSVGSPSKDGITRNRYQTDLRDSPTPFKRYLLVGVFIACKAHVDLINYSNSLVLCLTTITKHVNQGDRRFIGLPNPLNGNDKCFCGSGKKFKGCGHVDFFRNGGAV
jgi:hypothetical protein